MSDGVVDKSLLVFIFRFLGCNSTGAGVVVVELDVDAVDGSASLEVVA